MKKIVNVWLILLLMFSNTGCFNKDKDDVDIENIDDNFSSGYITSSDTVRQTEHFTINSMWHHYWDNIQFYSKGPFVSQCSV